jgi:hypothetical protein
MADALLFLVKQRPELLLSLPPIDRNRILTTVNDPEAEVRAGFKAKANGGP